jgi:hypothetical protein
MVLLPIVVEWLRGLFYVGSDILHCLGETDHSGVGDLYHELKLLELELTCTDLLTQCIDLSWPVATLEQAQT